MAVDDAGKDLVEYVPQTNRIYATRHRRSNWQSATCEIRRRFAATDEPSIDAETSRYSAANHAFR